MEKDILTKTKSVKFSQTVACDGQTNDITYGTAYNETHGRYLPLLQGQIDNSTCSTISYVFVKILSYVRVYVTKSMQRKKKSKRSQSHSKYCVGMRGNNFRATFFLSAGCLILTQFIQSWRWKTLELNHSQNSLPRLLFDRPKMKPPRRSKSRARQLSSLQPNKGNEVLQSWTSV